MRIWLVLALVAACSDDEPPPRVLVKRELKIGIEEPAREPGACPDLMVRVTKSSLTMIRGMRPTQVPLPGETIDGPGVLAAFKKYGDECAGVVVLAMASDVPYSYVVAIMDHARARGFRDIQFGVAP